MKDRRGQESGWRVKRLSQWCRAEQNKGQGWVSGILDPEVTEHRAQDTERFWGGDRELP